MKKTVILLTTLCTTFFATAESSKVSLSNAYTALLNALDDQNKQTKELLADQARHAKELLEEYNKQTEELLDENTDLHDRLMQAGKTFSRPYGESRYSENPLNLHAAFEEFELFVTHRTTHNFYLAMERWYVLSDIEREAFIKGLSPANARWAGLQKFGVQVINYNTSPSFMPKIYYFVHEMKKTADRIKVDLKGNIDVNVPKITIQKIGNWSDRTGGAAGKI